MQKDHLLGIIKTLTEKEKKDFKVEVSKEYKTKAPYFFKLYKQYEKSISKALSDEEIEVTLLKFFARNPNLRKDIANVRKQLKEKMLLHLVKAQKTDNTKHKVLSEIRIIEFLIRRNLFEEALIAINKTKKFAWQQDLNKELMEITDWHLTLIDIKSGKKDLIIQKKLVEEFNYYHLVYTTEITLKNMLRQYTLILQSDLLLQKKESQKAFYDVGKQFDLENFEIKQYEKRKHTHIVSLYYRICSIIHRTTGNFAEAFKCGQLLIEYFENDTSLISKFELKYIKSICSFTRVCQNTNAYAELERSIEKVKCLYEKGANHNALEATCDIGVLHYLNTHQYDKAIELTNFIKKEWTILSSKTIQAKLLWYCHSNLLLFWVINRPTEFEYWLNKGLNIPRSNKGKDFYFGLRMLDLIADFDNNQLYNFKEKLEAFQKTLKNNELLTDFEKIVLDNFRIFYNIEFSNKNINLNQTEKMKLVQQNFQSLKNELLALKFKKLPINYKEVMFWCKSHLQNKTIKEVFEIG